MTFHFCFFSLYSYTRVTVQFKCDANFFFSFRINNKNAFQLLTTQTRKLLKGKNVDRQIKFARQMQSAVERAVRKIN